MHFLKAAENYRLDGKPDFEQSPVFTAYVHALKHEIKILKIIIQKPTCYPTVNTPRLKTSQKTMTRKIIVVVHINNTKHTNIREVRLLLMLKQVANTVTIGLQTFKEYEYSYQLVSPE